MQKESHSTTSLPLALILVLVGVALVRCIIVDFPLGHDESVYAVGARGLLEEAPTTGWGLHRPVGMKLLAAVGLLVDDSAWALRLFPVVLGVTYFFCLFLLGRIVFGPIPALSALATLATSQHLFRRSSELLSDTSAALLVFMLVYVVVVEFRREHGPSWRLLLCAPLGAGAFYLRYGISLALAAVAISALLVWNRQILKAWRIASITLVSFAGLVLPFAVWSSVETGSPVGILRLSGKVAGRQYLGQGLSDYGQMLFHRALGAPVTIAVLIGFGYGLWELFHYRTRHASSFMFLVAVIHIALTGLFSHGEPRYIFLGIGILTLFGVQAIFGALSGKALRRLGPVAVASMLGFYLHASHVAKRRVERLAKTRRVLVDSAKWISDDSDGRPCTVFTSYLPQITWYTRCTCETSDHLKRAASGAATVPRYLLLFTNGKRQPKLAEFASWGIDLKSPDAVVVDLEGRIGEARIYKLP